MEPGLVALIIAVGFGTLICTVLLLRQKSEIRDRFEAWREARKTRRARLVAADINYTLVDIPANITTRDLRKIFEKGWSKHIEARAKDRLKLEYEPDPKLGMSVWFSYHTRGRSLRHWALVMHDRKYELRKREKEELHLFPRFEATPEHIGDIRNIGFFQSYYFDKIQEIGRVEKKDEEKEADNEQDDRSKSWFNWSREKKIDILAVEESHRRKILGYGESNDLSIGLAHIGWTTMSLKEVNAASKDTLRTFGSYRLLSNNCQNFVKKLAQTVVTERSEDWDWFIQKSRKRYTYFRPKVIGPPGGVAIAYLERLRELRQELQQSQAPDPRKIRLIDKQIHALEEYKNSMEDQAKMIEEHKPWVQSPRPSIDRGGYIPEPKPITDRRMHVRKETSTYLIVIGDGNDEGGGCFGGDGGGCGDGCGDGGGGGDGDGGCDGGGGGGGGGDGGGG